MRRPLIVGNWKMNGSLAEIKPLLQGIGAGVTGFSRVDIGVCPPFVYIPVVAERLQGTAIKYGAQNLSHEDKGAFTGEVSATMLRDYNCYFVIVGHSERRTLYGEDDMLVARKFVKAGQSGLHPILCVGELLEERQAVKTEAVVTRQLEAVLELAGVDAFKHAAIAYEPVWAIGTGKVATPEQAQEVHALIRRLVAKRDQAIAERLVILYGGSVTAANAEGLLAMQDVDGGLVGGASLNAESFVGICRAAENSTGV